MMKAFSFLAACFSAAVSAFGADIPADSWRLTQDLLGSGDTSAAALELRRWAADTDDVESRANLYLFAADAYRRSGDWQRMGKMRDHADEDHASETDFIPYAWLRLRQAEGLWALPDAGLWGESLARAGEKLGTGEGRALRTYALRRAAADYFEANDLEDAVRVAEMEPGDDARIAPALDRFRAGHDKSPTVGGLLGLIPGLGYAYSGEWGNMFRSMVLNGLFIWAMVDTARDDEWALFAVSTFFELTWYTGSIYGGIDAAHRYNRDRRDEVVDAILGETPQEPVLKRKDRIPLFRVGLDF